MVETEVLFSAKTKKIKHNYFSLCRRTAGLGSGGAHLGVVVGQCRGGGGDAAGGHGRGRGRGSAQAAAPQRLHAAPATNFPCLAQREQESKLASKQGSMQARKEASMVWGRVSGVVWC